MSVSEECEEVGGHDGQFAGVDRHVGTSRHQCAWLARRGKVMMVIAHSQ